MCRSFNPYQSIVITASAGSGKTHQLAHRYLHLAASLEEKELSRILTVTFTRKAAAEMQQRIIREAARMVFSPRRCLEMDERIRSWSGGKARADSFRAAARILRNSQTMRVLTMDSFFSWLARRFSMEAGLPIGAQVAEATQESEFHREAWFRLLQDPDCRELLRSTAVLLEGELSRIRDFLRDLYRKYRSTLDSSYGGDISAWREDLVLRDEDPYPRARLEDDLWAWLEGLLSSPLWEKSIDKREALAEYLRRRDLPGLLSSRFFKPEKGSFPEDGKTAVEFSPSKGKWPRAFKEELEEAAAYLGRYYLTRKIESYNRLLNKLLDLYSLYRDRVREVKSESGLVDFPDLAGGARKLSLDPGIAFTIQSGIQHLLIDEFQDTSPLQWEFFRPIEEELLSGSGLFEEQSFFAVGDLKQSIYGFREADFTLLKRLEEEARGGGPLQLLTLNRSYRSSPLLVDYFAAVFAGTELPDFQKQATDLPPSGSSVTIYPLITVDEGGSQKPRRWRRDAARIAASIKAVKEQELPVTVSAEEDGKVKYFQRPPSWSDIGVVYRKKEAAIYLESELNRQGIPCRREEPGGFYDRPEVRDLLALLDFFADTGDDLALATVLRSPLLGLNEEEFSRLLASRRRPKSLWETFRRRGRKPLVRIMEGSLSLLERDSLCRTVESFLQDTEARLRYRIADRDELAALNLDKIVDLLAHLSARGDASLGECRLALERMADEDETRMAGGAADCVRLMTIHKAKGLEFPILYLFDGAYTASEVTRKNSLVLLRGGGGDYPPLFYIPPAFAYPAGQERFDSWLEQSVEQAEAEELRILYVALTRAAQHLFISGVDPGKGDPIFYELLRRAGEALQKEGDWEASATDPAGQPVLFSLSDSTPLPTRPETPAPLREVVDEKIFDAGKDQAEVIMVRPSDPEGEEGEGAADDSSLIPERYRVLGTAVHRMMEEWCRGKKEDLNRILDRLLESRHPDRPWVEKALAHDRERMEEIRFFERFRGARLQPEVPILDYIKKEGQADRIVTGIIDLLAVFPDRVEFYDYKTSRIDPGRERTQAERYRRQMVLYRDALSDIFSLPVRGRLVFTATGGLVELP